MAPGNDDQSGKSIAREAAQLALSLQSQLTSEQIERISKEAAEEAISSFHKRYGLQAEHWVFLKELRLAHHNTSSWIKKAFVITVLTISLSFGADAILNELKSLFTK